MASSLGCHFHSFCTHAQGCQLQWLKVVPWFLVTFIGPMRLPLEWWIKSFPMHGQARRKHFLSGTATGNGSVGSGDPSTPRAKKNFNLHYSVVWIGFHSTFLLCTALPMPYLAMGQGGQLPPRLGNWLQSIIKYYLFIAASYWAIMDLPAPLSCFSRGFARRHPA